MGIRILKKGINNFITTHILDIRNIGFDQYNCIYISLDNNQFV